MGLYDQILMAGKIVSLLWIHVQNKKIETAKLFSHSLIKRDTEHIGKYIILNVWELKKNGMVNAKDFMKTKGDMLIHIEFS